MHACRISKGCWQVMSAACRVLHSHAAGSSAHSLPDVALLDWIVNVEAPDVLLASLHSCPVL
jgi:hypothetical protein